MVEENKQALGSPDVLADMALVQLLALGEFVSKLITVHCAAGEISSSITTPIRFQYRNSVAQDLMIAHRDTLRQAVLRGAENPKNIIPLMVGLCTIEVWGKATRAP